MQHSLSKILEELKRATVVIGKPSMKRAINLFDWEEGEEVQFNGYTNPFQLKVFLNSRTAELNDAVDKAFNTMLLDDPDSLDEKLEVLLHEVESFKLMYFPDKKGNQRLDRVILQKSSGLDAVNSEAIKARVQSFLTVQLEILRLISRSIKLRKKLLQIRKKTSPHKKTDPAQTSLQRQFDESEFKWKAGKADLVELTYALLAVGAIGLSSGQKLSKKHFTMRFSEFFDVKIPNPDNVLAGIKRRKKDYATFLPIMQKKFNESCESKG